MMGNSDGIADIIQDVFVDLYTSLNNGILIQNAESWLYRVTCNKCVDSIRKHKRRERFDINNNPTTYVSDINNVTELKNIMDYTLNKLKPKEKMLAVLYSEGLSYKEISAVTGLNLSSIGTMLSRTLLKIKEELKDQNYEMY
jgi:RNA polymerase sigma-70 factor (ECF subfamily)